LSDISIASEVQRTIRKERSTIRKDKRENRLNNVIVSEFKEEMESVLAATAQNSPDRNCTDLRIDLSPNRV
jgi:hypothetical protein